MFMGLLISALYVGGALVCIELIIYYIFQRQREKKEEATKDYKNY